MKKQKIVLRVSVQGKKGRNRAMQIVAGVLSFRFVSRLWKGRRPTDSNSIVSKNGSRAMTIAVGFPEVNSVSLKGKDKDEIEVIGNGVDAVELTKLLRRKMGSAEILEVSEVGESEKKDKVQPLDYYSYFHPYDYNYFYGGVPNFQVLPSYK